MKGQPRETSQYVATHEDESQMPFHPRDATEEEIQSLPHTVDSIPRAVWIVTIAGAAERFSYYAVSAPWQNYLQNAANDTDLPGALGVGQSLATNINNAFLLFAYLTPLPFAILSDLWLGKYKTLCISLGLYICGATVLMATSLPTSQHHGAGVPGLAISMVLIGLGLGGVKATISPFLIDQYTNVNPRLLRSRKGSSYSIGQRTLTIQYICNVFYWATNIAGLSSLASTFLEKKVGFWAAYLLPLCTLLLAVVILVIWGKELVKIPPQGNILPQVGKCLVYGASNGFRLEAARPSYQLEHFNRQVPWTEVFVDEMKRGIIACRVIFSMVLFYLCYNQISTNLVSQAGEMQLGGFPNDAIQVLNPIACIILGPIIQNGLYPFLLRHKIDFGPIARITAAFFIMGASMAYAAGVQQLIYSRGPCYDMPLSCPASDGGEIPNAVSVWVQAPLYFILATSEIFGFVTISEYAYSKAPKNMKALVQALTQFTACLASAVGMGISPASKDPNMVIFYAVLAGTTAFISVPFWWLFKKYDRIDENLNRLQQAGEEMSSTS